MRTWSFAVLLLALSAPAAMAADCAAPSPEETPRDQWIAERLPALSSAPAADAPTGISQADIDWALALEKWVLEGATPSAAETARYEDIARRLMALQGTSQAMPAVSQEEIDSALALEARVRDGVAPSTTEMTRYEDIFQRLQARQQVGEAGPAVSPAETSWVDTRVKNSACPGG
jgi:hypothetical protein